VKLFRVLVVAGATTAALLPAAGAATAATTNPTKQLVLPRVAVTTTSGTTLHFATEADRDSSGTTVDVTLDKATSGYANEVHDWTFRLTNASLTYSSGKGQLATGTQFGPYGALKVSFTKVSQTRRTCVNFGGASTTVTNVKATVKGVVGFNAKSSASTASAWGSVKKGTSKSPYKFGGSYAHYIVTTNGTCRGSTPPPSAGPCMTGVNWQGPFSGSGSGFRFVAGDSAGVNQIIGLRSASLPKPSGAQRTDIVVAPASAATVDTSGDLPVVNVHTKKGSAAAGSAKLTATAPGTDAAGMDCTAGGATHTQNQTDYDSVDFANGATPLTVASKVGGKITVADATGQSYFSTLSYS
jgi:hypothetical protein